MGHRDRRWTYILGGSVIGFAAGLLAARRLGVAGKPEQEEAPGLASRILKKVPNRIKLAAAMGAMRGAAAEAYREVKHKIKVRRRLGHE